MIAMRRAALFLSPRSIKTFLSHNHAAVSRYFSGVAHFERSSWLERAGNMARFDISARPSQL
jgi:hypothetical protein